MIRATIPMRGAAQTPYALHRERVSLLFRRLAAAWTRAYSRSPLERMIDDEVRRQLQHSPEPGDVVMVNCIAEDVLHRQML